MTNLGCSNDVIEEGYLDKLSVQMGLVSIKNKATFHFQPKLIMIDSLSLELLNKIC